MTKVYLFGKGLGFELTGLGVLSGYFGKGVVGYMSLH